MLTWRFQRVYDENMNKVKVFRSGVVAAPASRGVEAPSFAATDALRPEGHPTRSAGIFASPKIEGVIRWVRGNSWYPSGTDINVREISVNADTARVYLVRDWERASGAHESGASMFTKYADVYFKNSMTLTEWLAGDYDAAEWEVIFHAEDVLSTRNVSVNRLMGACEDDYTANEVKRIFRNR